MTRKLGVKTIMSPGSGPVNIDVGIPKPEPTEFPSDLVKHVGNGLVEALCDIEIEAVVPNYGFRDRLWMAGDRTNCSKGEVFPHHFRVVRKLDDVL